MRAQAYTTLLPGHLSRCLQELTDTTNEAMAGMETSILDGQAPNEAAALEVSDAVVKKFILNMSEIKRQGNRHKVCQRHQERRYFVQEFSCERS